MQIVKHYVGRDCGGIVNGYVSDILSQQEFIGNELSVVSLSRIFLEHNKQQILSARRRNKNNHGRWIVCIFDNDLEMWKRVSYGELWERMRGFFETMLIEQMNDLEYIATVENNKVLNDCRCQIKYCLKLFKKMTDAHTNKANQLYVITSVWDAVRRELFRNAFKDYVDLPAEFAS